MLYQTWLAPSPQTRLSWGGDGGRVIWSGYPLPLPLTPSPPLLTSPLPSLPFPQTRPDLGRTRTGCSHLLGQDQDRMCCECAVPSPTSHQNRTRAGYTLPWWTDRQPIASENITFPHTTCVVGKKKGRKSSIKFQHQSNMPFVDKS